MQTTEPKKYTVDDVKEILRDYRDSEKDIDMQIERLDRIEMKLKSIGSPSLSGMPRDPSPSNSRMADMIATKIDLENEIKRSVEELKAKRKSIESIISKLRHSEERAVIRLRYIDGMGWDEVLDVLFGGKSDFLDKEESYNRRMYMIHGSALSNMAHVLNDGGTCA